MPTFRYTVTTYATVHVSTVSNFSYIGAGLPNTNIGSLPSLKSDHILIPALFFAITWILSEIMSPILKFRGVLVRTDMGTRQIIALPSLYYPLHLLIVNFSPDGFVIDSKYELTF